MSTMMIDSVVAGLKYIESRYGMPWTRITKQTWTAGTKAAGLSMRAKTKWRLWFIGAVGSFAALEARALIADFRNPGEASGTLSYWWRGVLGVRDKRKRRFVCGAGFLAFCAWLGGHMTFGLWSWHPERRRSS